MLSDVTVFTLAITASHVARISTSRRLSRFEEKSAGVWFRVEIRPSAVIAKLAVTNGRMLRLLTFAAFVSPVSPEPTFPRRLRVRTAEHLHGCRAFGHARSDDSID